MRFPRLMALLRRFPHGAICIGLTLVFSVVAWFLRSQMANLDIILKEREKEGEATMELLIGGSTQRQELNQVREVARRIEENLGGVNNLAENYGYFYRLEEQTKVHLSGMHQSNPPASDNSPLFTRIPYSLRVNGTFEQVAAFLLGLETGPRLVNITAFSCVRTAAGSTGSPGISLDLSTELLGKK